jgi:hypothetical protein
MLAHRLVLPALASLALSAAGCGDDGIIASASLRVTNNSDFQIVELYLTDVGNPDFGPNLLRGDVLNPGEDLLLGVSCGFYDVLLIDEQDVQCQINDLDLCLNDADFVINNNTCSVFGARKAELEAQQRANEPGSGVRK